MILRPKHLSMKGAQFIGRSEGFRGYAYNDPVGFATVGFGHLLHRSNVTAADAAKWGTKAHPKLSRESGLLLLVKDAERYSAPLAARAKAKGWKLNQPQFDALVSFSFNVGTGWLSDSGLERTLTAGMHKTLNPLTLQIQVRHELLKWDVAGGKHLPGLHARREREARLFATGVYL